MIRIPSKLTKCFSNLPHKNLSKCRLKYRLGQIFNQLLISRIKWHFYFTSRFNQSHLAACRSDDHDSNGSSFGLFHFPIASHLHLIILENYLRQITTSNCPIGDYGQTITSTKGSWTHDNNPLNWALLIVKNKSIAWGTVQIMTMWSCRLVSVAGRHGLTLWQSSPISH